MEIYVVGGAVRDRVMGKEPKDLDYVIVGAGDDDIAALKRSGYNQVGADFPVFLSPEGDEYALARKERKVSAGYHGFEVTFDASVTLVEDLSRRDLTMNSMAVPLFQWNSVEWADHIIDPFNGRADIEARLLRHTSDAFKEDPVRVLRIARFAARYDFTVANDTIDLCHEMAVNGELKTLVGERVWKEFSRALAEDGHAEESGISKFFDVLKECGAYAHVFPNSANLENPFYDELFGFIKRSPAAPNMTSFDLIARCHHSYSESSSDVMVDRFAQVAYAAGFSDETLEKIKPPSECTSRLKEYRAAFPLLAKMYRTLNDGTLFNPDSFNGDDMAALVRITRLRQYGGIRALKNMFRHAVMTHYERLVYPSYEQEEYRQRFGSMRKTYKRVDKLLEYVNVYYTNTDFTALSNKAKAEGVPIKQAMDNHATNAFNALISNVMS